MPLHFRRFFLCNKKHLLPKMRKVFLFFELQKVTRNKVKKQQSFDFIEFLCLDLLRAAL